jgi:hypothetical protein
MKVIEAAGGTENRLFLDAFNDTETMVWVNDLVTDLKCHISPVCAGRLGGREARRLVKKRPAHLTELRGQMQGKLAQFGVFRPFFARPYRALSPPMGQPSRR